MKVLGTPRTVFQRNHTGSFHVVCNAMRRLSNSGCVLKSEVVKGVFQNRLNFFFHSMDVVLAKGLSKYKAKDCKSRKMEQSIARPHF